MWVLAVSILARHLALGESEAGTGLLHQAVAAYQAALEERCRDLAPSSWATTNSNLGNALIASRNAKTAPLCWKRRPRPIAPRLRRELRVNAVEGLSIGIDRLLEMFAITFLNP
jgi:hypothetical protein